VKVVSRNTERPGEARGPKANEGPLHFFEEKFLLPRSCRFKAGALRNCFHNPGFHNRKPTFNPEGVEDVVRVTKLIANGNQLAEAIKLAELFRELGIESGYNCIWDESVAFNDSNCATGRYLIADAIQYDHFSVEVDERSEPKVSVAKQAGNSHCALI